MKTLKNIGIFLAIAAIGAAMTGCGVWDPPIANADSIDDNILNSMKPVQPAYTRDIMLRSYDSQDGDDAIYNFEVVRGYTNLSCFDPGTPIIWPGAILDGQSIVDGSYRPIIEDRAPLTITCTIGNTQESVSETIEHPTYSKVTNAFNRIVFRNGEVSVPAWFNYSSSSIYSYEHLLVELGINAHAGFSSIFGGIQGSLKERFDYSNTEIKTRLLVKFYQFYYSCNIDQPSKPSDLFDESVGWDDIDHQITDGIVPGYVASIKYGRMLLFFLQSSEEETTVRNAFEAALEIGYCGFTAGGKTELTVEQESVLNQSTIEIMVLGGHSHTAMPMTINTGDMAEWLTSDQNAYISTPVVPLCYEVDYLSDNTWMLLVMGASGQYRINDPDGSPPTPTDPPEQRTKVYSNPGTEYWTPPDNLAGDIITVTMVGGGGGGGGDYTGIAYGPHTGKGGKAGEKIEGETFSITMTDTLRIRIGSGGSAGIPGHTDPSSTVPATPGGNGEASAIYISGSGELIIQIAGGDGGHAATATESYDPDGKPAGFIDGIGDGGDANCPGGDGYVKITYMVNP
ncbi:MAG: thiol-activated cytolysin family protein [Spirochaetales bacterium]|nr:thiol-activated cytolysin family protein [Spirochaetales bacterium]